MTVDGIRPNDDAVTICRKLNLFIHSDCSVYDVKKNAVMSQRVQVVAKLLKYF